MFAPTNPSLYQAKINKDKGPSFIEEANGNAYIETYTVINDREGPSFSILFGRSVLRNGYEQAYYRI